MTKLHGMRTSRAVHLALGLGLLVGAVAVGAPGEPAISVRLPQTAYNVRLTGRDIIAPHLQLFHSPREIRGRAFGRVMALSLTGNEARGAIGGVPINLRASLRGDTLRATGGFLGGSARLLLSPTELRLSVRGCTYTLQHTADGRYVGPRSCDARLAPPVELTLPEVFHQLTPAEQATLLLLALS